MRLNYIACVLKHKREYNVLFPDFEGFFASGRDRLEAEKKAKEGLLFHIEGMVLSKIPLPIPSKFEEVEIKIRALCEHSNSEPFEILEDNMTFTIIEINIV